ncbi:hypothetical protein EV426DRAFT_705594 [Tirmania nivea]|nr:hypothetical protein EV426DRAFT_705594 [Tirmania nivea]
MILRDKSGFCWFAGLCGGRRRRQRWQQSSERDVTPPVQPKTARFYGVQPLFTELSPRPASRPMLTLSECGTDIAERNKESSTGQSVLSHAYIDSGRGAPRSQIFGGEKLERWLGESLKTIPENGRFEFGDGYGSWPRTYLLSFSSPATTSHGPSTEGEEFELVVQGTSELSVAEGEDWGSITDSTYARPQTSYTATLCLGDRYTSSHEAIQNFLAAMQGRQSVDCSSMTSEYTDCASWVFRPLQPAPMSNQLQGFYNSQSSSEGPERSNSTNSRTEMSEISTELAFSSGPNSEYGEKRIILRRMHSSSTFRSRFGGRHGDRNSMLLAGAPDPPMPSAQIPWRTVSIRAVRRKILEPQTAGNWNFPLFTPLLDLPPTRDQICHCPPSDPEVRTTGDTAASDVSRVHHWVSGQQQQYQVSPAPTRPSEFLV